MDNVHWTGHLSFVIKVSTQAVIKRLHEKMWDSPMLGLPQIFLFISTLLNSKDKGQTGSWLYIYTYIVTRTTTWALTQNFQKKIMVHQVWNQTTRAMAKLGVGFFLALTGVWLSRLSLALYLKQSFPDAFISAQTETTSNSKQFCHSN